MTGGVTETAIGSGRILPRDTRVAERYRIVRLLGIGAMGMVYLARDEHLDLDIALKVLRTDGSGGELRLERFRSELVLARQISHRNVVRIHDIGHADGLVFITMDYVEGRSLKHRLEQDGPLGPAEACAIAADLAEAAAEAHDAGVVHRDIKPANVLIGSERAYLTDFGIARSLQSDGLTRTGEIVGTLDYLAPEQALGKDIDGRADIYALGLLLYEMLNGSRPFSGETAEELLAQRTLARPRDITAKGRKTDTRLRRIMERCLALEPDERYPSAAELAADLRSGALPARRWPRLRTLALAAAVVALAAGLWTLQRSAEDGAAAPTGAAQALRPVAVLPFEVAAVSGDLGSIAHALAQLLGEELAASTSVSVVSGERVNSTLRALKLSATDLPAADQATLGDLLDAELLVSGRLQQIDASYRLEARLRHAASGELLHRASVDVASSTAVFSGMHALAADLLRGLDLPVHPARDALPAVDAAAMQAFATGVERLMQGNALGAITPLEAAVDTAPEFALAWDRLAQARAAVGRDLAAREAAQAAVDALGGRNDRSAALVHARHAALGGDLDAAASRLEAILREYPGDIEVRFTLAEVYGDAGQLNEATAALRRVVAESPDHPQAWYLLGKFAILQGDARRAADDYLVKALVIQNRLENDQGRADVLNALGIAEAELGNSKSAARYYRQALELRERIDDERGVAAVLANLARIDLRQGRYAEARTRLAAARDKLADIGDRSAVANLENELGFLEEQRGRFEQALDHYREALRLRDQLGDRRALAESYNNVGYAYYLLGEFDNATVFNDRSLNVYRETGNAEGMMLASQTRGILSIARGRYDDALKALIESLEISRNIDDPQAEAIAQAYIARVRHLQGRYAAAATSYDEALDKLAALGDTRGQAEFALLDAALALDVGMLEAAAERIADAQALLVDDDNRARRALGYRIEGAWLDATGNPQQAAERFAAALEEAEASGDRLAILHARLALAASRGQGGDAGARIDELRSIHEEAARLGHGALHVDSGIMLARACLRAAQPAVAETVLRSTLQVLSGEADYHGRYQLQALLADALRAQSRPGAAAAWQAAAEGVQAALSAQNESQRSAFRTLPLVQRILEKQVMDNGN